MSISMPIMHLSLLIPHICVYIAQQIQSCAPVPIHVELPCLCSHVINVTLIWMLHVNTYVYMYWQTMSVFMNINRSCLYQCPVFMHVNTPCLCIWTLTNLTSIYMHLCHAFHLRELKSLSCSMCYHIPCHWLYRVTLMLIPMCTVEMDNSLFYF